MFHSSNTFSEVIKLNVRTLLNHSFTVEGGKGNILSNVLYTSLVFNSNVVYIFEVTCYVLVGLLIQIS